MELRHRRLGAVLPYVSGGMVYLGALAEGDHRVHALDAMTGEVLWFAERPYPFTPEFTPTVAGDKVYVPGGFGEFRALDASTGKVVWSFNTGIPWNPPPQSSEESYT